MASPNDELRTAQEQARRAREDARKFAHEARDIARRMHREHREAEREGDRDAESVTVARELLFDGVRSISINQTAGKVIVRPVAEGESPGLAVTGAKTPPRVDIEQHGDRIEVHVRLSTGWLFRRRRGATTIVRVVTGLDAVSVNSGAGEVEARELTPSRLRLESGAGEIRAFACGGELHANVGAGRIAIQAHRGLVRVDTGTGDISVDIAEAFPGEYRGNTGIGRCEFRLPAGLQVHIRVSSGIGKSRVEYPSAADDAPIQLRVETGIGEASVKARPSGDQPPPPAWPMASAKSQRTGRAEASRARREAEQLRVLQMLEQGKISTAEAADLIAALQDAAALDDEA
jgi:hypothetical protein